MNTNTNTNVPLLGAELSSYTAQAGAIADVERSVTGNTVLRIGQFFKHGEPHWVTEVAHVVLTPRERELLIALLVGHRVAAETDVAGS